MHRPLDCPSNALDSLSAPSHPSSHFRHYHQCSLSLIVTELIRPLPENPRKVAPLANKSDSPLSYVSQSVVPTVTTANSTYLKNGRDEHRVCVGKAEEGGIGICSLLRFLTTRTMSGSYTELKLRHGSVSRFWHFNERRACFSARIRADPSFHVARETPGASVHFDSVSENTRAVLEAETTLDRSTAL